MDEGTDWPRGSDVSTVGEEIGKPPGPDLAEADPRPGTILAVWMLATLSLQAGLWLSGGKTTALAEAVDRGAALAESRGVGEVGDDTVRKAIALQHDTLPFWTTVAALEDFAAEPLALALRAGLVATLFAGLALLKGRPVEFARGFDACARAQGFWVLGLGVLLALTVVLRRAEVETSAALLLPPGAYAGLTWAALRQLDAFALMGWSAMALGGWRRGQVGALGAFGICLALFLVEAAVRLQGSLVIEAGMRLSLLPDA